MGEPKHNVQKWVFRFFTQRASADLSYSWKLFATQAGGEVPTCYDLYSVVPGDVSLKKAACFPKEYSLACSREKMQKHVYDVKKFGRTTKKRPKVKSNPATSYIPLRFNFTQLQLTSHCY